METTTKNGLVYVHCVLNTIPKWHKDIQGIAPVDDDGHTVIQSSGHSEHRHEGNCLAA